MTKYVHHTNSVIDRAAGPLPRSWRNISGLDRASPERLRELGWLPVVDERPDHDPQTHYLTGPAGVAVGDSIAPDASRVVAVYTAVERPPPAAVSPLQARRALRAAGLHDAVTQWIASQGDEVQEAWEYAVLIERDNPIVAGAAAALGMTDERMNDLFRLAAGF